MPDQPGAKRDVIQSGRERLPRRPPSTQLLASLVLVVLLVVVVVAVVAVHAVTRRGGTRGPRGPVLVTDVGHPLLRTRPDRAAPPSKPIGPGT